MSAATALLVVAIVGVAVGLFVLVGAWLGTVIGRAIHVGQSRRKPPQDEEPELDFPRGAP